MRKKNNMLIFVIVVVFGVFSFTLNTGFAESLQAGKGNIDKLNFSSPAAEENFIQYGQLDNDFSLETAVKDVLSIHYAPFQAPSFGCTSGCPQTMNCSVGCTPNTYYCSGNCGWTVGCQPKCSTDCILPHPHAPVCE
jgi:hypothetical protein